jgi:hypothetical protein
VALLAKWLFSIARLEDPELFEMLGSTGTECAARLIPSKAKDELLARWRYLKTAVCRLPGVEAAAAEVERVLSRERFAQLAAQATAEINAARQQLEQRVQAWEWIW